MPRLRPAAALLACLASGCSLFLQEPAWHEAVPAAELDRVLPPAELAADFEVLLHTAEAVHPDLYAVTSREVVSAAVQHELAALPEGATRLQFQPALARVVALFGDAHTQVPVPGEEWNRFLDGGGRVLPCAFEVHDGLPFVAEVYGSRSPLQAGDEVLDVNGLSGRDLVARYRGSRAGSDAFVFAGFAQDARALLWRLGVQAPFAVHVRRGDGETTVTLPGLTRPELARARAAAAPGVPYRTQRLPGDVALLDFRSMQDADAFGALLDELFTSMRQWPARGLVVDLRRNGGGDSQLGDLLLAHVTDRPYRMAARKDWRSSAEYRAFLKQRLRGWIRWLPLQYLSSFGREFWGVEEGGIVRRDTAAEPPERLEPRFDGPVAFLIGPNTFSSAMMLADAAKAYGLARSFGEPTGGWPNGFGELYPFDLPHSRLLVLVSSARFVGAAGDEHARGGVVPDEVVPAAPGASPDPVLAAALRWIAAGGPR